MAFLSVVFLFSKINLAPLNFDNRQENGGYSGIGTYNVLK